MGNVSSRAEKCQCIHFEKMTCRVVDGTNEMDALAQTTACQIAPKGGMLRAW